jgi:hypothetical protein
MGGSAQRVLESRLREAALAARSPKRAARRAGRNVPRLYHCQEGGVKRGPHGRGVARQIGNARVSDQLLDAACQPNPSFSIRVLARSLNLSRKA